MAGADDNASGTALLLETARLLTRWVSAHPAEAAVRRSIMFQAWRCSTSTWWDGGLHQEYHTPADDVDLWIC